jgi:hypothetical protein
LTNGSFSDSNTPASHGIKGSAPGVVGIGNKIKNEIALSESYKFTKNGEE